MWGRESALLGEVLNTPPSPPPPLFSQSSFVWHTLRATMWCLCRIMPAFELMLQNEEKKYKKKTLLKWMVYCVGCWRVSLLASLNPKFKFTPLWQQNIKNKRMFCETRFYFFTVREPNCAEQCKNMLCLIELDGWVGCGCCLVSPLA